MSGGSRAEKVKEWSARLGRYERSGLTVAPFCRAEGVSQGSFYLWKKKLREVPASSEQLSNPFRPVHVPPVSRTPARPETVIRLGPYIQIELGSDSTIVDSIVESIVKRVLVDVVDSSSRGGRVMLNVAANAKIFAYVPGTQHFDRNREGSADHEFLRIGMLFQVFMLGILFFDAKVLCPRQTCLRR